MINEVSPFDSFSKVFASSSVRFRARADTASSLAPFLPSVFSAWMTVRVTGGAVEEVAIRPMPRLDCVWPVGIGLAGSAAHVDVARRHLGVEPQRIERRVAC